MPYFFFDVHDGGEITRDDVGIECANIEGATVEAKRALPAIAAEEVPRDGDCRTFTVVVRNSDGRPVYSAALSYIGTWLDSN